MRPSTRKSAPEVKDGKVQKKNDWTWTPNYYSHEQREVIIDRRRPGKGYRHLLLARDIRAFIALLPDWNELATGLNAIVLAPGRENRDGYYYPHVVHICAWDEDLWIEYDESHFDAHRLIFERLGVPYEPASGSNVLCKFEDSTAKAYQLLHIFLHELGHHHDLMTTQAQKNANRGETYAEEYALRYEALIWERYQEVFRLC